MSCGKCETCSCSTRKEFKVVGEITDATPTIPIMSGGAKTVGELNEVLEDAFAKQTAIRQFLSRPAPGSYACGCMGPQPLPGEEGKSWEEARRQPLCPCAMSYVEQVNGRYYKIGENRSPDGITHTATDIGPVGGPYLVDQYGRPR